MLKQHELLLLPRLGGPRYAGVGPGPRLGLGSTVIRRERTYVHIYEICHMNQKHLSVCFFPGVYVEGFRLDFSSNIGHSVPFLCTFTVFYTYLDILFYVQINFEANTGRIRRSIRILRRIIRNTLTFITYATATAYDWLNIRVWTQPWPRPHSCSSLQFSTYLSPIPLTALSEQYIRYFEKSFGLSDAERKGNRTAVDL
jgi:hypothetical protein